MFYLINRLYMTLVSNDHTLRDTIVFVLSQKNVRNVT